MSSHDKVNAVELITGVYLILVFRYVRILFTHTGTSAKIYNFVQYACRQFVPNLVLLLIIMQVMVCTTTFGMGVDVPDVEVVVRVGCPSSLEELVQEFGRAGRDGRPAKGN